MFEWGCTKIYWFEYGGGWRKFIGLRLRLYENLSARKKLIWSSRGGTKKYWLHYRVVCMVSCKIKKGLYYNIWMCFFAGHEEQSTRRLTVGSSEEIVSIPKVVIGTLIGKGGENIKSLTQRTRTRVQVCQCSGVCIYSRFFSLVIVVHSKLYIEKSILDALFLCSSRKASL